MTDARHTRSRHLRGLGRLTAEATLGLTELVEALHRTISAAPGALGPAPAGPARGIPGLVYGKVRGATRLVSGGADAALDKLAPLLGELKPSPRRDVLLAVLNGVLGDHLEASGNPLATPMHLRRNGAALGANARFRDFATAADVGPGSDSASPVPLRRLVLLVHGLCMNEAAWNREGNDYGAALERDLGFAPAYLRYNTGRHVSINGRELAGLLETYLAAGPVPRQEVAIVAHSMGGLVTRSALHYAAEAGHAWPRLVGTIVFLGTPHHGAPWERAGNVFQATLGVSPYSLPFAHLGKIRSAGITDLRHGSLLDDDWDGHDRFGHGGDNRHPVPLPSAVACYAVAASTASEPPAHGRRLAGDGIVPVESALGHHRDPERTIPFPPERTWIARGMNHYDLLGKPAVYERIREWLGDGTGAARD